MVVAGRQDSKYQKFLSKRSTSISPSHPHYLHTLSEHRGSQDSATTGPMVLSRSSRGSLPLWGSNPSQMRSEKLQNFDFSTEELKLTALSTSRGTPTFQQPSLVHPLPETDVVCELTTSILRFPTGTGKTHPNMGQKSWQQHQQQEQTPELRHQRDQPSKDNVSRQDSGIGSLSTTSRCDFRY